MTNADSPTEKSTIQSNVRIPETLRDQLNTDRRRRGITTGELIILAIESTYDRLRSYIHPAGTVGGKLFAERGVGGLNKTALPTKQVAFSVTRADFTVLDQLVTDFSARDRAHLITAALTAYFDDTTHQGE